MKRQNKFQVFKIKGVLQNPKRVLVMGLDQPISLIMMLQAAAAGSLDDLEVRSSEVLPDTDDGEVHDASRRGAHPHMNNLVYGRRSDPHLDEELSGAVCRQVLNRCARWRRQQTHASESH